MSNRKKRRSLWWNLNGESWGAIGLSIITILILSTVLSMIDPFAQHMSHNKKILQVSNDSRINAKTIMKEYESFDVGNYIMDKYADVQVEGNIRIAEIDKDEDEWILKSEYRDGSMYRSKIVVYFTPSDIKKDVGFRVGDSISYVGKLNNIGSEHIVVTSTEISSYQRSFGERFHYLYYTCFLFLLLHIILLAILIIRLIAEGEFKYLIQFYPTFIPMIGIGILCYTIDENDGLVEYISKIQKKEEIRAEKAEVFVDNMVEKHVDYSHRFMINDIRNKYYGEYPAIDSLIDSCLNVIEGIYNGNTELFNKELKDKITSMLQKYKDVVKEKYEGFEKLQVEQDEKIKKEISGTYIESINDLEKNLDKFMSPVKGE